MKCEGRVSRYCVVALALLIINQDCGSCSLLKLSNFHALEIAIVKVLTNASYLMKSFRNINDALKVKHGTFMLNQSFHDDLAESCRSLRSVYMDYSFFKTTGICPNLTSLLIEVDGTAKLAVDLATDATVLGYVLTQDIASCDNLTDGAKDLCYLDVVPSIIKDLRMFMSTVVQFMNQVKFVTSDVQKDGEYCFKDFNQLPQEQRNAIVKEWTQEFLQKAESCDKLADDIIAGRSSGGSGKQPTTSRPASNSTITPNPKSNSTAPPAKPKLTTPAALLTTTENSNADLIKRVDTVYNHIHDIINRIPRS